MMENERLNSLQVELVVIGGGPAGLAAAEAAARCGINCLLFERSSNLGGQYKAVAPQYTGQSKSRQELLAIERLVGEVDRLGVGALMGVRVYRADLGTLYACNPVHSYQVNYQALVLASGARERVMPFSGWTLPGVIAVGAAQRMLVQAGVIPGQRVLVSGSGPFLIVCAALLVEAGVQVRAVVEANPAGRFLGRGFAALAHNWRLSSEVFQHLTTLRKAKVPLLTGRVVIEARGEDRVETAYTASFHSSGDMDLSTRHVWQVDAVCVSHGLLANTRLAQTLGCELAYDPATESHFVAHDERLETSQSGIYVCGEAAGIGGVKNALLEGELAGLEAATALHSTLGESLASRVEKLRQERRRLRKDAALLNALYPPYGQLSVAIRPETIICRCEEVTAEALHSALEEGDGTMRDLKMRTRLGMGLCQGRMCEHLAVHELAFHGQVPPDQVELLKVRPPLEPVALEILANSQ